MAAQHQEDPRMPANENEPRTEFPLDCEAYELGTKIGVSDKATVYKAICLPKGSAVVAVKSIDLDRSSRSNEDFFGRAWRNTVLSHPNLLPIHCFFDAGDRRAWVVMPFMSHGSIGHIVSSYFLDGLPENCVSVILRETLNAIAFLHDRGLVHGAIKPGNILVDSDGSVKLADFGLSASAGATTAFSDAMPMRSPYWVSPKAVQSRTMYLYWFKADISLFGMTALELIQERLPLRNISDKKISKSFREMVALCLELDLAKRPSASELLRHRFFKKSEGEDAMVVKNIVQGLPGVDDRPSFSDQEDLVINPDPVVKRVQFGGETIIQPTRTEGFDIGSPDPNVREILGKEANDEHNIEARVSDSEMNRIVMEMLMNLKESLEDQIAGVVRLIELLGGEVENGNGGEAEK